MEVEGERSNEKEREKHGNKPGGWKQRNIKMLSVTQHFSCLLYYTSELNESLL